MELTLLILLLGDCYSQSQSVKMLLAPAQNARILGWEENTQVDEWQIEILKKIINNGVEVFDPVIQYTQEKNYIRIPEQYFEDDYFYKVTGLDSWGSSIVFTNNPLPVQPGKINESICLQQCNGNDYAYQIEQRKVTNQNGSGAQYYLSFGPTSAWVNDNARIVTPFWRYIESSAYTAWEAQANNHPKYNAAHHVSQGLWYFNSSQFPGKQFKNSTGTVISGGLIGIPKYSGDFYVYDTKITSFLASEQYCSPTLVDYKSLFNLYKLNCNDPNINYPVLDCQPDPNNFVFSGWDPIYDDDPTIGSTGLAPVIAWWLCAHDSTPEICNPEHDYSIPTLTDLHELFNVFTLPTNSNRVDASDIAVLSITNVFEPNTGQYLSQEHFGNEDGSISLPSLNLSAGLYKMYIVHANMDVMYPYYFEVGVNEAIGQTPLSNDFSATVYPVPITENNFSVSMSSNKDLNVRYELLNLNGEILNLKSYQFYDGEEIIARFDMNPNWHLPSNVLVHKFYFDDGSTYTIQTIKSWN